MTNVNNTIDNWEIFSRSCIRIDTVIDIDRPQQNVFDFASTPALWHTWHPATVEVRDGRLRSADWSWFNGKTRVAFTPRGMTAEELLAGFQWFRARFHSFPSLFKRMAVSRAEERPPPR